MSIAVERAVTFRSALRAMPGRASGAGAAVEQRQLHSELVLVCPELRSRLRGLLPERASDAFVAEPAAGLVAEPAVGLVAEPAVSVVAEPEISLGAEPAVLLPARAWSDGRSRLDLGLAAAVLVYAGQRLLVTAFFLIAIGALFVLLTLAEV